MKVNSLLAVNQEALLVPTNKGNVKPYIILFKAKYWWETFKFTSVFTANIFTMQYYKCVIMKNYCKYHLSHAQY